MAAFGKVFIHQANVGQELLVTQHPEKMGLGAFRDIDSIIKVCSVALNIVPLVGKVFKLLVLGIFC